MIKENQNILLSEDEVKVITELNHSLYTVDYIQHWINRDDNVFTNAVAALSAMGAKGYYEAVRMMVNKK